MQTIEYPLSAPIAPVYGVVPVYGKAPLKSPLRYPGGKFKVADLICSMMPPYAEYREPFFGGGSVGLCAMQHRPDANYWFNDLYPPLYNFWFKAMEEGGALMERIRSYHALSRTVDGKTLLKVLRHDYKHLDEVSQAAVFFVFNRSTFLGLMGNDGYSHAHYTERFNVASVERVAAVIPLMDKAGRFTNVGYERLLEPYVRSGSKDVFVFLDPPYLSNASSGLYGGDGKMHSGFNHPELCAHLKQTPHKWLMTYDDCPEVREMYGFADIIPLEFMYGIKRNAGQLGKEVIIKNY